MDRNDYVKFSGQFEKKPQSYKHFFNKLNFRLLVHFRIFRKKYEIIKKW